jgi:predicted nucleotidyltransferase
MQSTYDRIHYYKIGEKQKEDIVTKVKLALEKDKRIKLAWLFGSLTRRDSVRDLDIAIYAEPAIPFKEFLYLNAKLELELGYPVDMVPIDDVPQSLRESIFKNGVLIKGTKSLQEQLHKNRV